MSSSSTTPQKLLTLRTSACETFTIEEAAAVARFEIIQTMVDDGCAESVIPVSNIDGEILAMVLEWCKKHHEMEGKREEVSKWDAGFVKNLDTVTLYKLLMAADYLGGAELLDLLVQKAADMIKGKKAEQIRRIFNIKNDFTPEEEEALRSRNPWAFY